MPSARLSSSVAQAREPPAAYLAYGIALLVKEDSESAVPAFDHAATSAIDAFDDLTFVEAFARKVYAATGAGLPHDPHEYAEHVATRTGAAGAFVRALLFNNLGAAELAAGRDAAARTWFDRALAEPKGNDPELLQGYANRALVTKDPAERAEYFAKARSAVTEALGPNSRNTLDVRFQAAVFITEATRAEAELAELCRLYATYYPSLARETIASCLYERALLAEDRGDIAAARDALLAAPQDRGPMGETIHAYVLALAGKLSEAAAAAHAVADKYRDETWARLNAADAYALAAAAAAKLGQRDAQHRDAAKALALYDQLTFLADMAHYQRRIARVRALMEDSH